MKTDRASPYADWIRGHKCAVAEYSNSPELVGCIYWQWGQSEAAHIKHRGMGGRNAPEDEGGLLPLCRLHHSEFHSKGVRTFMGMHGLESAPGDYLEKYRGEREFV